MERNVLLARDMQLSSYPLILVVACATPPAVSPSPATVTTASRPYLLLEPTSDSPRRDQLPVFRALGADRPERAAVEQVLARPFLQWVLAVGEQARALGRKRCGADAVCAKRFDQPAYFVITDGGNRPHQGLVIETDGSRLELPEAWYVEIDPDDASTLIPHEYGHVMMFASLPGDLPREPQTLPHTTGAITNDVVAFSEGWGIHFETLAGDRREQVETYARWHRDAFVTDGPAGAGDSVQPVTDLFNYAQTYRRYTCIKENCFAYLPRIPEAYIRDHKPNAEDVLARWTDTTYDPARVRSLAQMVASEGVIATLFYRLATAPSSTAEPATDRLPDPARYAAFFDAFSRITEERARTAPVVLVFLEALLESAEPDERRRIARIALEVLHYTPSMSDAPRFYAELHAAGHRVDKPAFTQRLASAQLERAVARLVEQPTSITEAVVSELWITNEAFRLELPILGVRGRPLVLDLNAAPIELLMTIPGVGYEEAIELDVARRRGGLRAVEDVAAVSGIRRETVAAIHAMRARFKAAGR